MTLNGHFDGKTIVLDEPVTLPLRPGARVTLVVEPVGEPPAVTPACAGFKPLNIRIAPELSNAIALDDEFNIEES